MKGMAVQYIPHLSANPSSPLMPSKPHKWRVLFCRKQVLKQVLNNSFKTSKQTREGWMRHGKILNTK
jgi:hypothetical protein